MMNFTFCISSECVIGSNVRIEHAIICDNVCVEDGCTIPMGCIISFGVRLSAGTILKPYTRITVDQSCFGKCSEWTYDQGIYFPHIDRAVGFDHAIFTKVLMEKFLQILSSIAAWEHQNFGKGKPNYDLLC